MKAVVLLPGNRLGLENVKKPRIEEGTDVLVRVTVSTICGSDLHIKHGLIPGVPLGSPIGHEFVGVVEEVGSDVTRFRPGDRVAAPPATWCGYCPPCRRGDVQHCFNGAAFGCGDIVGKGGLKGAQAEYARVPFADNCLTPIPDNVADEQAVFVGDVFGTGYHAAHEGRIDTGETVIVYGCGPIGLGAVISAWQFGPKRVFAVDVLENRLALAESYGATVIDARAHDPVAKIREVTGGEGADVALETIGNPDTFQQALKSVRRGGSVSVVGLFPGTVPLNLPELGFYGIKIRMGLANVSVMPRLMPLLESGRVDLTRLGTHTFPLDAAMEAYELFENHKEQCLKVLLKP